MTTLKLDWDPSRPYKVIVYDILTNRFMLRGLETTEERLERKILEKFSTPQENLGRLMREGFDSQFRATELYPWMETNAPGYQVGKYSRPGDYGIPTNKDIMLVFSHLDHVMLFKLTWG